MNQKLLVNMNVKFVKYYKDARMPEKAHGEDYGYDVYAVSEEEIAPGVWRYGLGFGLQPIRDQQLVDCTKSIITSMSEDNGMDLEEVCFPRYIDLQTSPLNIAITFRPRSSIHKTGMMLANTPPTGDEGYTGEYKLVFYHVMKDLPRYKVGDKIAQLHLDFTFPANFIEVEMLEETDRGNGGFGSTGK